MCLSYPFLSLDISSSCCTGQDTDTFICLLDTAFNPNRLEWKNLKYSKQCRGILDLGWAGTVEAVLTGQSCNLPAGIRLHCGGLSALPCHLLVCVWLDVSEDVCVHHPLWRTTKLTSLLPGHTPASLWILECFFSHALSWIFLFWFW